MPPRWPSGRRRRVWTRGLLRFGIPVAVVALVVAFIAGAVADIGSTSRPYDRTVDRGFAALAGSVAVRSNATGAALTALLSGGAGLGRTAFFSRLDRIAADATTERDTLDAAVPPAPAGNSGAGCLTAVADRAAAVARMRLALEGLLGGPTGTDPLDASAVASDLSSDAGTLAGADAAWASCRNSLRRAVGRPRLGASRWLTDVATWSPAALGGVTSALAGSRSLAASPALSVVTVVTSPPFLPGAQVNGAQVAVLPYTNQLTVHAVVSNTGNVQEPKVMVSASLSGGPNPASVASTAAIGPGGSVSVVLAPLAVAPGSSYTLVVSATAPSGAPSASMSLTLQVATLPPTTTTTTTTVPRGRRPAGTSGSSRG